MAIPSENRTVGATYFWNLVDRDSDRRLSDTMLPHTVLLPGGFENTLDGNLFEFEAPWLFERAGILDFQFRLINPILQMDSAVAGGPAIWDDRENGVRRASVKVRAELHGVKFLTGRDLVLRDAVREF